MKKHLLFTSIFIVLLAVPLVGGGFLAARAHGAVPFSDVHHHAYGEAITYLKEKGIIQGYADGTYKPQQAVNRAEFVKILVGAKLGTPPTADAANCFPDVKKTDWFSPYVCHAKTAGIVSGYPDGSFKPANFINLAEASKIVVNTLGVPLVEGPSFPWYQPFVDALDAKNARPPSLQFASQQVNRGEMAEMMWRLLEEKTDQPAPPDPVTPAPPITSGNPEGQCVVPAEAQPEEVSSPDHVIGTGTPESCTSADLVSAVAQGGTITFNCGPNPHTLYMTQTAKVVNNAKADIVIDGGGLITLDGMSQRRILYMNTCDPAQVWTTPHCDNQDHPRLTVQNLTFQNGTAVGQPVPDVPGGGGAIFVRGGRFKILNSNFFSNRCEETGTDVGGAAVRVLSQFQNLPVYVVNSTFGGSPEHANVCSNGGGLSSIQVSFTVLNSLFSHNQAIGYGANPAASGTPGGGSGGGIYNDGDTFTLSLCGTAMHQNHAREGGGAIFFVSNTLTGNLKLQDSTLSQNPSDRFETEGFPGIFYLGSGPIQSQNSLVE